ncbi:rhomboid family intramembrane serine protease [Candidatus Gracilibacteria bacterium]|nr:rhomboid family intramembrane serine protease [Candidatus Gracilibacteria bacterium]
MQNKTISNSLILISLIITLLSFISNSILQFGMNLYFVMMGNYIGVLAQFSLYQFLHGGFLHLLSNSIFIYLFGNQIEALIGKNKYILFFILNTIFVGISLLFLSSGNTIGISGFAMALLAYYFLELKGRNHPDYKGALLFLIINISIGLGSNISFVGHLSGAIFGAIFYYSLKKFKY